MSLYILLLFISSSEDFLDSRGLAVRRNVDDYCPGMLLIARYGALISLLEPSFP